MPTDAVIQDIVFILSYSALAFIMAIIIAPLFITFLKKNTLGKKIRTQAADGKISPIFSKLHKHKSGIPTMGGVIIWGSAILIILFSRFLSFLGIIEKSILQRSQTYLPIAMLAGTAILGIIDDLMNVMETKNKGLNIKPKIFWLTLIAGFGAWWFHYKLGWSSIHIPAIGDFEIGIFYIPLFMLVIIATANAVNITDGLDGLAGGLLMIAFASFGIIAYTKGLIFITAFCSVVVGGILAFLWFNVAPAKFFMGDTGSLSLGATLGVIAMLTNSIIPLIIIGGVFVFETLSDIIQILSKKIFKKKFFKCAPFHHHLEAIGWTEYNIVFRFWLIGSMLAVIGVIIGIIGAG